MTEKLIHEAVAKFDAIVHELRAHLLHSLGVDEKQLAHDAEAAAKPVVAEAKHDAETVVQQVASDTTKPAS